MQDLTWPVFASAALYSVLGIALFVAAFVAVDKATPYKLWKEIIEEKNVALAIVVGAMSIAMGIVIAAAIH
jgi:uncharacterized membrane protein YjfL (UPF0719 family)